jgi:probable addiction module antidote protein
MVELPREDPSFADEYLAACLEAMDEPGGHEALLMALRQVAQAQGMDAVAARAGIQRESLYCALSPKGNPTLRSWPFWTPLGCGWLLHGGKRQNTRLE